MAVANYHAAHGQYPPAFIADENGKPMHSWRVLILPYLEHRDLYERYDFSQAWNSEANIKLAAEMPRVYAFHGEFKPGTVTTNYLAVLGQDTFWPGASPRLDDEITDPPETTIMLVENYGESIHWMAPQDLAIDTMSFVVDSPQGISSKYLTPAVVMLDGSLRRLQEELPVSVLRAMLTVNGGEQLEPFGDGWRVLPDGRMREVRKSAQEP